MAVQGFPLECTKCIKDDLEKNTTSNCEDQTSWWYHTKSIEAVKQGCIDQAGNWAHGALSHSQDLLESAAVSVDSLKTENMSCQKSLLNAKDYLFCPTKMNSYPSSEKHGCYWDVKLVRRSEEKLWEEQFSEPQKDKGGG